MFVSQILSDQESLVDLEKGWLVPAEPYPLQRQCPKRGLGPLKARGILVTN